MILATWIVFDILMLFWLTLEEKKVPFLQVFFRLGNECISSSSVIFFHFALVMLAWWSFPDGETTVSCRHGSYGESPFSACYLQLLLYGGLKLKEVWLLHYFLSSHFQLMMNYSFLKI